MTRLQIDAKAIRARLIAQHLQRAGRMHQGVVCFTCGNAAAALRAQGLHVVEIGPAGDLMPTRWWQPAEIARAFPTHFDATSGHLPWPLIDQLAREMEAYIGQLSGQVVVPSGSGETAVAVALAFPDVRVIAEYNNAHPATSYSCAAPMNALVERLCTVRRL